MDIKVTFEQSVLAKTNSVPIGSPCEYFHPTNCRWSAFWAPLLFNGSWKGCTSPPDSSIRWKVFSRTSGWYDFVVSSRVALQPLRANTISEPKLCVFCHLSNKLTKPHLLNHTFLKLTKSNLPNQTCLTEPTKPILLNLSFEFKSFCAFGNALNVIDSFHFQGSEKSYQMHTMGRGVRDGDSLDGDVGRGPNVDGIVLVGLFGRNRGIRVAWVRKEVSREGSVSKDPENQVKIEVKLELDPVGSTVRYEMMKLCTMSV